MLIEMIQNRRRAARQNGREPGSSLRSVNGPIGDSPTQEEIGSTYQSKRKINRDITIDGPLQISPNNSRLTPSIIDIKGAGYSIGNLHGNHCAEIKSSDSSQSRPNLDIMAALQTPTINLIDFKPQPSPNHKRRGVKSSQDGSGWTLAETIQNPRSRSKTSQINVTE